MQVKLELEVTLTPEAEVSSTVVNNSYQSHDGDSSSNSSNPALIKSTNTTVPTVIPPTTIVCLPSVVSVSNPVITRQHGMPVTSSSVIQNVGEMKIKIEDQSGSSGGSSSHMNIVQHKPLQSVQKIYIQNPQIIQQHQLQQQTHQSVLQQQQQSSQQNIHTLVNPNAQQKTHQVKL